MQLTASLSEFFIPLCLAAGGLLLLGLAYRFLRSRLDQSQFSPLLQQPRLRHLPGLAALYLFSLLAGVAADRLPALALANQLLRPVTAFTLLSHGTLFLFFLYLSLGCFDHWQDRLTAQQEAKAPCPGPPTPLAEQLAQARLLLILLLALLALLIFVPDLAPFLPLATDTISSVSLVLLTLGSGSFVFLLRRLHADHHGAEVAEDAAGQQPEIPADLALQVKEDGDFAAILAIVELFVGIFRCHLEADSEAPVRINLLKRQEGTGHYIFEIGVELFGQWKKRRLTVGRLAAEAGSRSTCFCVIYDDYLVVKVPPEPLTDALDYVVSLQQGLAIVEQLAMEECIIPGVSVVFKHCGKEVAQHGLQDSSEEIALELFAQHPRLYRFLQVGDSFAYFMDMSRYYFLKQVIKELHQGRHGAGQGGQVQGPCGAIIANLVNLLATLGQRGVAIRDLKPDNLMVAGERSRYPAFLHQQQDFVIGLIDIETAAIFAQPTPPGLSQPLLGGTPQYATPSQFLNNDLLRKLFGSLGETLHYQDWYAMISVIAEVATERPCFAATAPLVVSLARQLNQASDQDEQQSLAKAGSGQFWRQAEKDLLRHLEEHGQLLATIKVGLVEPGLGLCRDHFTVAARATLAKVSGMISEQTIYPGDDKKKMLQQASVAGIHTLLANWQQQESDGVAVPAHRHQARQLLEELLALKTALACFQQACVGLAHNSATISAPLLMQCMFHLVKDHMDKRDWHDMAADTAQLPAMVEGDKTCLDFQTVLAQ